MGDTLDRILSRIGDVRREVYSFGEYLELVRQNPGMHFRNAASYMKDCMEHYGRYEVRRGPEKILRFHLFDGEFTEGLTPLVGNEDIQKSFHDLLTARASMDSPGRLILIHGPNGSAKTTFLRLMMAALEHYSGTEEGAVYRFNWIFPSDAILPRGIGFRASHPDDNRRLDSYAHLEGNQIDAILMDEFRDHPLLLIPVSARRQVLEELSGGAEIPEWLLRRDLHPRNRQIFDALLLSSGAGVEEVLKYVQVERFRFSFRYRKGMAVVEPKLAVDAHLRQVTADRSLSSLPPALQHLDLYRFGGDLVDGNRGMIEFSDIFKRPPEAFRYLLTLLEDGRLSLDSVQLHFDSVFCATANDRQLTAFTETPDFASFEGRTDFLQMPYLLDYRLEERILGFTVTPERIGKHITPHVLEAAALWAVMTRLVTPSAGSEEEDALLNSLSVYDKALLYADGRVPEGFTPDEARQLLLLAGRLRHERLSQHIYEGGIGASPRLLQSILTRAASRGKFLGFAGLQAEIRNLYEDKEKHEFLNYPAQERGYHDIEAFAEYMRSHWLMRIEEDLWAAAGLVLRENLLDRFSRYLQLVNHYIKGEKIKDEVSGEYHDPPESVMNEMEDALGIDSEDRHQFRQSCITRVAAYVVDHGGSPDIEIIFGRELDLLTRRSYDTKLGRLLSVVEMTQSALTEERMPMDEENSKEVDNLLKSLKNMGYEKDSLIEVLGFYLQEKSVRE